MKVAVATEADVPAVLDIMNDVIAYTTATFTTELLTYNDVAKSILPPSPCLVMRDAGQVIGYTRVFPFRSGPGYAHVVEYSIALTAEAQGKGVGRNLFNRLCDLAYQAGKTQIIGAVSSANIAAIAFHKAMGFEQVGHIPDAGRKWDQSLDLLLMQKRL